MRMKHNQSFNYVRNNMILTTLRKRAAVRKPRNQRPINSIQNMYKRYYGISTINIFNGFNKKLSSKKLITLQFFLCDFNRKKGTP